MKNKYSGAEVTAGCLMLIAIALIYPVISFVVGAFFGWVLSVVFPGIGLLLISGLNLFHFELTLEQLPLFTATLGFIGQYFKSTSSSK